MGFLTDMISFIASIAASNMLVQTIVSHFLPPQLRHLLLPFLQNFFPRFSSHLSMVVEDGVFAVNKLYVASEAYLSSKISRSNNRLKVSKAGREKRIMVTLDKGEEIVDVFDGVKITWRINCTDSTESRGSMKQNGYFELSFNKIHMDKVLNSYFPHILDRAKAMKEESTPVRIFTLGKGFASCESNGRWSSVVLDHPSTFETLAMEETQKADLMNDLKKFVERKQIYRQVGKAWKRGYLLYGPPGTGKSSLIAAMANFLKFDIYDLEFTHVFSNSHLRNLLMSTSNKSIFVIEDIDCTQQLKDREEPGDQATDNSRRGKMEVTLSGFLNFIDGLWSSCGDERIIVFTTNHKEKLDPALLRPGRMDMHIYMGYCCFAGFRTLASKYLGIHDHPLFEHIKDLLQKVQITPAEVGEAFMRSELDNPTAALLSLIDALRRKEGEKEEEKEDGGPVEVREAKEGEKEKEKEDGGPVEVRESADHGGEEEEKTEEEIKFCGGAICDSFAPYFTW